MKLNKYFFKKHWHTLRRELLDALRRGPGRVPLPRAGKGTILEFQDWASRTENVRLWLRKNIPLKDGKYFLKTLYARLVTHGEYTKRDLAVLFIVAFFAGIGSKAVATQTITIGFEDYTLPPKETLLNLNDVQKKMIENGSAFIENDAIQGGVCSE